jgi:hypothetical protein
MAYKQMLYWKFWNSQEMKKCVIMTVEVDISESEFSSVINSENKETEEALGYTRAKRHRREQGDWQIGKS